MITVYTVLFGDQNRDRLRRPPSGCTAQYVCFADAKIAVPGWTVEQVSSAQRSPVFLARLFKTRPDRWFGREATTIWIDASCELLVPADRLVAEMTAPIMALAHPDRCSVEAEAETVAGMGLVPRDLVRRQLETYRSDGFVTRTDRLTTTGLLARTPVAHYFNLLWEEQIIRYHLRDQLSVDYCAWATETPISYFPGHYRNNDYMRYHRHVRLAS